MKKVESIVSFECPSCHNKTLYDIDSEPLKVSDVDYHDRFICDECGSEYLAEPQYNGTVKFLASEESRESLLSSFKSADPSAKVKAYSRLRSEICDQFLSLVKSPTWGYESEKEVEEYLAPMLSISVDPDDEDYLIVEFRAEVNYEELEEIGDSLNKVIQRYDKDAYFEPVTSGITRAYINLSDIEESINEGTDNESVEQSFEKDDRVTDGDRQGTVIDCDSEKVLVEWDYSDTDDIEWVDKSDLSFVECLKESEISMDTVKKDIQSYLNYHLGSNEDYIKVTNVTNVDKNTVAAEYEVHLSIPIGNDEYERDTEYRSLPFRYKDGKWQPVVTESKYDIKTKTTARKLVDKAKADVESTKVDSEELEAIVNGLDENGYNLNVLSSIKEGLWALFGYQGKDAFDVVEELVTKGYIDSNVLIDAGYTPTSLINESLSPYKKEEFKKQLQDELYDKFIDLARTPEWGFENLAEIGDYLIPTIEVNDYEGEYDNDIEVEFRAEVNYREMEDVCNTLDKVVNKYDKNAYFEPVQPGIAVAYLKFPKIKGRF